MINLNGKNILVTGANGMIGKELVRILKQEYQPRYISEVDLPDYDLRDRNDCENVCEGQEIIFHLAGIKVLHKDVWRRRLHLVYQ